MNCLPVCHLAKVETKSWGQLPLATVTVRCPLRFRPFCQISLFGEMVNLRFYLFRITFSSATHVLLLVECFGFGFLSPLSLPSLPLRLRNEISIERGRAARTPVAVDAAEFPGLIYKK